MRPNFGHHPINNPFRAVVVLGSPRRECAGSGICMITTARAVSSRWRCPYVVAEILKVSSKGLYFRFLKHTANGSAVVRHFLNSCFEVSDAYTLPLSLTKRMGLARDTCIAPGRYVSLETDEVWGIFFALVDQGFVSGSLVERDCSSVGDDLPICSKSCH